MGVGGSKPTPEEQMREQKRMMNRAIRELDRERMQLQNQEKKVIADIKAAAKKGQTGAVKIMAKDLVRTRKYISKFYEMKSQLQAVQLRLQTMKSTEAMVRAMKGCTHAMSTMNKTMNSPEMAKILSEFQAESDRMGLTEDMMTDTIDDALEDDEEDEERIVAQVLDEMGIDLDDRLAAAPGQMPVAAAAAAAPAAAAENVGPANDLEARLEALKR